MKTTIKHLYPDIWQEVFEYFNAIELFFSLAHVTKSADQVLFHRSYHFRIRGLVANSYLQTLPEKLMLSNIVSLELHQESPLDIVEQCLGLRSLKLVGQSKWIISLLRKVSYVNIQLEQLTFVISDVDSLYDLLMPIALLFSLRRLEIHTERWKEKIKIAGLLLVETKIEQFILHTCSSISWNDLSNILPSLPNIRFIDVTLLQQNQIYPFSFYFPKLRYMRLSLNQVSFECIIKLVATATSLIKIKLTGLVDSEGFVVNHKWFDLFESCSSLISVIVNVSLEEETNLFCNDIIQTTLHKINLNLVSIDDDSDYFLSGSTQFRWWTLSGMITKRNIYT